MYRPVGLASRLRFAHTGEHVSAATGARRHGRSQRMTQKDFVVSADGHLLEPIDLFKTRLPAAPARPGRVGGGVRDRAVRRGRRPGLPQAAHARVRGLDGLALPPDAADARPRAIPSIILEDMDADGVDAQVLHPNLSQFGLFTDHHEMSIAHARVYNDYVIERFTPYFDRLAPTAPDPAHRHRRRRRRDRAGRRRRVQGGAAARHRADAVLPRDYDPVWAAIQDSRHERVRPHPDRRHQGQRPRGAHAEGHDGERRSRSTSR